MNTPDILFEDSDIIVCHKPAGIATQTRKLGQQDMESILKNYRAKKKEMPYIGVVHRLDQPVEGVMVFAKNQKAAAALSKQVSERTIGKYYYAVGMLNQTNASFCEATGLAECGTLQNYMITDKRENLSRICNESEPGAKKAQLNYRVIKEEGQKVWFDIELLTGRQHQIRLQLSHIGCPICGDTKYGTIVGNGVISLCAYKIELVHPTTKQKMSFSIEMPQVF